MAENKDEPKLLLRSGANKKSQTRSELLKHPALETITIEDRSAYEGQTLTFKAIPAALLFEGVEPPPDQVFHYDSIDGFSSSIDPAKLLNRDEKKAIAYIAIEPEDEPWPTFGHGKYGAGPFYLVWKNPEKSGIGREEWPFKLKSFVAKPAIDKLYPDIFPDKSLADDHPVQVGFRAFVKNCFPCHTMNLQGSSRFGPDLNLPHNPTEYLLPDKMKMLIRDPQSLRSWPGSKMTGFPEKEISEPELEALLTYLEHMATRKVSTESQGS